MIKTTIFIVALAAAIAARAAVQVGGSVPAPAPSPSASGGAAAAPAPAPPSAAPAPATPKENAASSTSVESIYDVEHLRDPFRVLAQSAMVANHKFNTADFSIHNLTLKGIMGDARTDVALFSDNTYGYTLVLRNGRLYDPKGKPVSGVVGKLDLKRRRASLQTQEGDVQVFRLGSQSTD